MPADCPSCGYRYGCPCGCETCPTCDPLEAPARSLVSGVIGRGLADAAGYRQQLDELWNDVVAALPDD